LESAVEQIKAETGWDEEQLVQMLTKTKL